MAGTLCCLVLTPFKLQLHRSAIEVVRISVAEERGALSQSQL